MAVKQYENFRNPIIQGKADRNNLANQRMNTYSNEQQLFARDPAFATGRLIGQAIVDGYNNRGISKGMEEMRGVFNSLGQPQQPQQATPQPTTVQPDMSNAITMPGGENSEILNQPFANPTASVKDVMAQEKRDYRIGKYIDSDNPGTEAIQNKNDIKAMDQAGNNLDFSNLNKEDVREQVRQQLEANGRTSYQIEQVLGQFDRMYDSKYNKWADNKVTDLIGKGEEAAKKGDWEQAQNYYMAAGKYNPKMASMYMQGLNSAYNRKMQAQQQRDKEFMAGYMRDENGNLVINPNHPTWNQRKYGGVSGSGSFGSRGGVRATRETAADRKTREANGLNDQGFLTKDQRGIIDANEKIINDLVKKHGADFDNWTDVNAKRRYRAALDENNHILESIQPIHLIDNDYDSDMSGAKLANDLADAKHEKDIAEDEANNLKKSEEERPLQEAIQLREQQNAQGGWRNPWTGTWYARNPYTGK